MKRDSVLLRPVRALARGSKRTSRHVVRQLFFGDLIAATDNFSDVTWLGHPVWQNVLDLWIIQEAIYEVQPHLLLETGTNRGGSAMYYAHIFDLMDKGRVITCDMERMHELSHPRIIFLQGGSTSPAVVDAMRAAVAETDGAVMVILDSDHSERHVAQELETYGTFVTPGSLMLVQDGVIDTLARLSADRPGPLPAIREYLRRHPEFEAEPARSEKFLVSHHPSGWLRRKSA
jgi:cephalosporin hydroxylase